MGVIDAVPVTDEVVVATHKYYVDPTVADQGVASSVGDKSIKDFVDTIGTTTKATLYFMHTSESDETTYTVTTAETIPSNITLFIENGAVFGGTANALTVEGYVQIGIGQVYNADGVLAFSGSGADSIDHGGMSGLTDDDHSIYHNNARGDARYYTETEVNAWRNSTTQTEMGYLHGVTSDIQTQIDSKMNSYVKVSEVQTAGTGGGTFTQDDWRTRVLNTEDSDTDNLCSLSSNQITLSAGTYICKISAPAYRVAQHKIRLRNVTGSTDLLVGTSEMTSIGHTIQTRSFISGKFTIAAAQALEIQHYCTVTYSDFGFGVFLGILDEVYTIAEFWRVA
jgi:hypothetical protein